jgi:hypothetical protein
VLGVVTVPLLEVALGANNAPHLGPFSLSTIFSLIGASLLLLHDRLPKQGSSAHRTASPVKRLTSSPGPFQLSRGYSEWLSLLFRISPHNAFCPLRPSVPRATFSEQPSLSSF